MVYEGFMTFGGNEVINSERLRGYAETSDCPPTWFKGDRCESLADALGHEPYLYSDIPLAPWYDPSLAEVSSRFYGIQGLSISGLDDSTRSASLTEGVDDGGTLSRARKGMRSVRARGTLMAQGRDALEYGVSWLNSVLDPGACGQHGTSCGTTDMEFFADCPPERGEVDDFSEWVEVERNLATNPSFESGGPEVPLYENLLTNPSFESGSGVVEVRRNRILNPQSALDSRNPAWGGGTGVTEIVGTGSEATFAQTWTATGTGGVRKTDIVYGAFRIPVVPGEVSTIQIEVADSLSTACFVELAWDRVDTTFISLAKGATQVVSADWQSPTELMATGTAPAEAAFLRVSVNLSGTAGVTGETLYSRRPRMNGQPYFDGSYSPDADLTASWVGEVNASASILTGAAIPGISTRMCLAIRSSKFGGSMRLIPTSASDNNSYAEVQPYPGLLSQQTLMAKVHLEAPLTGALGARSRQLYSATPLQGTPSAPNAAGSYSLRTVQTPTSQGRMIFYHGGLVGSGDIYWTEAGILAGDYAGPWFDGSHPYPEADFITSWTGEPNASTTIVEGRIPTGWAAISGATAIARSEDWASTGGHSMWIDQGMSYITLSESLLGQQVTIRARARLAGQIMYVNGQPSWSVQDNEVLTFSGVLIVDDVGLGSVGAVGFTPGPGYWDDFIVTLGDYQGDYFDGNTAPLDDLTQYRWVGEENASESVKDTRESIMRPQTDEEYAAVVDPLRRFLHDVSVTSGPLRVEIFESNMIKDLWGATFEWTITSERAWIYSLTRPVDLPVTETTVMESTPFNLVPYPSMTLAGDSVVIATNYSLNPSVETNADGWSYSFSTISGDTVLARDVEGGRVTGELQAVGGSSYRTRLYIQSGPASGRAQLNIQQDVDISTRDADSRVSISVWSALVRVGGSGDSAPVSLSGYLAWLDAAGVPVELVNLGEISDDPGFGGTVFSATSLPVPAGAVEARIIIQGLFDWVGPVDMRMYADALAVTVP